MNKILAIVAFALGFAGVAQAASFQSSTGLASPTSVETFDGATYANGTAGGTLFSGLSLGSDLTISTNYSGSFPNMVGQMLSNFEGYGCCSNATAINFTSAVSGAAFNFVSNPQNFTFSAFLAGNLVEAATYATNFDGNFIGFTGISFDKITILGDGSSNNAFVLDNLQIAAVPEPSTYAMLLAGLGMLGFAARRKRV